MREGRSAARGPYAAEVERRNSRLDQPVRVTEAIDGSRVRRGVAEVGRPHRSMGCRRSRGGRSPTVVTNATSPTGRCPPGLRRASSVTPVAPVPVEGDHERIGLDRRGPRTRREPAPVQM